MKIINAALENGINLKELVIDLEILTKFNLSFTESVVLSIIREYTNKEGYCSLSITDFSILLEKSYMHTSKILNQLKNKRVVNTIHVDGKKVLRYFILPRFVEV